MRKCISCKRLIALVFSYFLLAGLKANAQPQLHVICPPPVASFKCISEIPPVDLTGIPAHTTCPDGQVQIVHLGDQQSGFICPNRVVITRTYQVTDHCNNVRTCSQEFTIFDDIPPNIICPPEIVVECITLVPAPDFSDGTVTDNCGGVQAVYVRDQLLEQTCPGKATIARIWKARDACGNESPECAQIIRVNDDVPPIIFCPVNITVKCAGDVPAPDIEDVFAVDNCGEWTVTHEGDQIHSVICDNKYKIDRRYKAVDVCGNEAYCTQVITVFDDILPVITCPPAITVECLNDLPAKDFAGGIVSDNCGELPVVEWVSDQIAEGNCPKIVTRTYRATDLCGNQAICTQLITVTDNVPPIITCPPDITVQCPGDVPAPDVFSFPVSDNCGGVIFVAHISDVITNQTCPNRYLITRTYRARDICNNIAFCTQLITVFDDTPPVITSPTHITIPFTTTCGYNIPFPTGYDNCPGTVWVTWTDVETQCGNELNITRTWIARDDCYNSIPFVQHITVTDNNTDYIVYATSEAKFGEGNEINGDVGVTATNGKADFKKHSVLDPYDVWAKTITVQSPATVNNKHVVPATGGPAPPHYSYGGGGLSGNHTQSTNGIVPAGNFKNLTIKKGVTATVNGSNYGKITIEENADVSFTSGSIDVEDFIVKKGKSPGTTDVHFDECTGVRVKDGVDIEEDARINGLGPKVIFYMGANKEFSVRANYTEVTANVHGGKLKVSGPGNGGALMTGWYIVEKLESDSKNVIWSPYDCTPIARNLITQKTNPVTPVMDEGFAVSVYPNPSGSDFNIRITGDSEELVQLRVYDLAGKTVLTKPNISTSTIQVGNQLQPGVYFAELRQGSRKQTVKLIKLQ